MALLRRLQGANYRLLGLVGQGQFGQVYCAVHRRTGRLVALKNLNRDRLTTHRFLRELRFLLSLEHPNIANCSALEQSATGRQLVLDYCEGGTLRQLMEQATPLPLEEILALMAAILDALDHAHSQGIVHCDIKPENILLVIAPGAWRVKISDFGIARLSQELRGKDQSGATGSPAYMAPERFYHQHSASSDLYALGVILFELLTGDRPFTGTPSQLMVAHLNQPVAFPPHWPEALQGFLRKALQKLMARRYRTAGVMKAALEALRPTLTAAELATTYPLVYHQELPPVPFVPQRVYGLPTSDPMGSAPSPRSQMLVPSPTDPAVWWWVAGTDSGVQAWTVGATQMEPAEPPWVLPAPVQALWGGQGRALAVTAEALFDLLPGGQVQRQVTFPAPVTVALSPGLQWAMGYSADDGHLWQAPLGKATPELRALPVPQLGTAAVELLALDDRHLLLAAKYPQRTDLHVISRRGPSLGKLTLHTAVQSLTLTRTPRRILAQETTDPSSLLIIDLLPFRVLRCRLDVPTPYLGELAIGYVACSDQGHLRFVNAQGQLIGRVDGLPCPAAIAVQFPHHIWLATAGDRREIHAIDIQDLGLDIIF